MAGFQRFDPDRWEGEGVAKAAKAAKVDADEYDAAQGRGEVAKLGDNLPSVPNGNSKPTAADVGLSRKDIHEAREIRGAETVPDENGLATLATLASVGAALPGTIGAGLGALDADKPPRGVPAEPWRETVLDAQRLASDGWAASALSLGWSPLDLFGAVTDREGDPNADGLAVMLYGRRILAICESFATIADANGKRSYFYRGNTQGARLLWALGRGR